MCIPEASSDSGSLSGEHGGFTQRESMAARSVAVLPCFAVAIRTISRSYINAFLTVDTHYQMLDW